MMILSTVTADSLLRPTISQGDCFTEFASLYVNQLDYNKSFTILNLITIVRYNGHHRYNKILVYSNYVHNKESFRIVDWQIKISKGGTDGALENTFY